MAKVKGEIAYSKILPYLSGMVRKNFRYLLMTYMRLTQNPVLALTAFAALILVSCEKNIDFSNENFPADGVVRIDASVSGLITKADLPYSGYTGSDLGLFIDYGDGDYYSKDNLRWVNNSGIWSPESQVLWKNAQSPVGIYAYAPHISGADDHTGVEFSIPSNQVNGTFSADFLWYSMPGFVPADDLIDQKLNITFSHALVKLKVNLIFGNEFDDSYSVKDVILNGTSGKVRFDLANRTVTDLDQSSSSDISMCNTQDGVYEAIFFPGKGQKGGARMLTVVMSDNKAYNVTIDSDLELYSGHAYTMNVKVGKDKLEAGSVNVFEWQPEKELDDEDGYIEEYSVWDGESTETVTKGSGSESDPYLIESAAQLAGLAYNINNDINDYKGKYFKLMKDIDLASKPWTPVGNKLNFPHLRLDGNGKSIINLKVDESDGYAGLFYWLSGTSSTEKSVVRNLTIRNADVKTGGREAGVIVGFTSFTDIMDCRIDGSVTSACCAGGIVGSGDPSIINCRADVNVTVNAPASKSFSVAAGGLIGDISFNNERNNSITNCTVKGSVTVNSQDLAGSVNDFHVGGVAGSAFAKVSGCMSYADVNSMSENDVCVGGLAGSLGAGSNVENCAVFGTVIGKKNNVVGGVYGSAVGNHEKVHFGGKIGDIQDAGTGVTGIFIGHAGDAFRTRNCSYSKVEGSFPVIGKDESNAAQDIRMK